MSLYNIHDLHHAIKSRQLDDVRHILSMGVNNINQPVQGATALSLALYTHSHDVLQLLLDRQTVKQYALDLNQLSRDPLRRLEPPLVTATRLGMQNAVEQLVSCGADLECVDVFGHTSLWMAAHDRQFSIAVFLLKHGATVLPSFQVNLLPVFTAARLSTRRTDIARLLILAGANGCNAGSEPLLVRLIAPGRYAAIRLLFAACHTDLRGISVSPASLDERSHDLILNSKSTPASLLSQCRWVVRRTVVGATHGCRFLPALKLLPLPKRLREYVALHDELIDCHEPLTDFGFNNKQVQTWSQLVDYLMNDASRASVKNNLHPC